MSTSLGLGYRISFCGVGAPFCLVSISSSPLHSLWLGVHVRVVCSGMTVSRIAVVWQQIEVEMSGMVRTKAVSSTKR